MANRGGPGNPLSLDELKVKFMANAARRLDEDEARALAEAITRLEGQSLRELLAATGVEKEAAEAER
jgi:hypothetical protein